LDHLLTLTYRENVTDFDRAGTDLNRFVRLVKKHIPDFLYLAVPEKQKRGAWHWHMAVKGRQDVILLRQVWRKVVGEGNIDVQQPKGGQDRRLALVRYLSKYLAKGFELDLHELNGHRFRASLGLNVPTEVVHIPPGSDRGPLGIVLDGLIERGGQVGFVWQDDSGASGWACSWK
jgi:hypothetical protein